MAQVFLKIISFAIGLWVITVFAEETPELEETTITPCNGSSENSCEAFNVTEISSAIPDTTTKMASKKPKSTTTTIKPGTKPPRSASNSTKPQKPHSDCSCDHTNGSCEINCCCDVDCNVEQKSVFTHCVVVPHVIDSSQCFPMELVHHNNTDYRAVETEPGVLCVVQENTFAYTDFLDVPVIRNIAAMPKKLGRTMYYSWPNLSPEYPIFNTESSYTKNSPIWVVVNSSITYLELPSQVGVSSVCHGTIVPRYLQEVVSSCTRPLQSEADCRALSAPHFTVISSYHLYNFSEPLDCTEDVCLQVITHICLKSCIKGNISLPVFNRTSSMCHNVVSSVEYQIHHNGSRGVVQVRAYYVTSDVAVRAERWVRQEQRITYRWAGAGAGGGESAVLRRSGRPGYEVGRPVISGWQTAKGVAFNLTAAAWISVSVSGSAGRCRDRQNLLFGENIRTQCLLEVNGTCKQIQQQIWNQLLGPVKNVTQSVISSYGDPRVGESERESDSWAPLLASQSPPLPALVTGMDLIIMYSLVGSQARPQAKIIAAYINPLPSSLHCQANHSLVMVESSVKFIDKTRPAVTKFAEPPVYEIKLPQDFFYPFLSHGNRKNITMEVYFVMIIIISFSY